jgi:hypothetical protein
LDEDEAGSDVMNSDEDESCEAFTIRMDFMNNNVVVKYNPKIMLHRYNDSDLDLSEYQSAIEHIKRRIDWCVRKSAGEEPNLDDYTHEGF